MLKHLTLSNAASLSTLIAAPCLLLAIVFCIAVNHYCKKTEKANKRIRGCIVAAKTVILILFAVSGLFIGNILSISITYNIAISHGMVVDNDKQSEMTYGEIQMLNKNSICETDISPEDLKGKIVIFVRYDCNDCIKLHDQLVEIQDVAFLSSRSEQGKITQELYNIHLTEVPQGVYIDPNGASMTVCITQIIDNTLMLDLQQLSVLREMANRRVLLSNAQRTLT